MNLKSKKGFTLVELIIVIAILGIIALIAVPNLTGIQKRSQINADIRTAEQIGKAVRIWLTDCDYDTQRDREADIASATEYGELEKMGDYIPTGKKAIHNDGVFNVQLGTDGYITVLINEKTAYSENAAVTVSVDTFLGE